MEDWLGRSTADVPEIMAATWEPVSSWVRRFLEYKEEGVQTDTNDGYEALLEVFSATALVDGQAPFGDRDWRTVTSDEVLAFLKKIKNERFGRDGKTLIMRATVDHYFSILRHFWVYGLKKEAVDKNVVIDCGWKVGRKDEDYEGEDEKSEHYFEPEQYKQLLTLIRPDFLLFVRFMGETGVRFSEATALRIEDLNFETNKAHVRRAWKNRGSRLGDTKGKRKRWVEVTPDLMNALRLHVKSRARTAWLFTAVEGGHIRHSNFRKRQWIPAMLKAQQCPDHLPMREFGRSRNLRIDPTKPSPCDCLGDLTWTTYTPHALRHTYATWCILDPDVSIKLLSEQLGHKDTHTTESIYIHVRTRVAELGTASAVARRLGHTIEGRLNARHLAAV